MNFWQRCFHTLKRGEKPVSYLKKHLFLYVLSKVCLIANVNVIQIRRMDEKLLAILRKLFGSGWGIFGRLQVADESGKKTLETKKRARL